MKYLKTYEENNNIKKFIICDDIRSEKSENHISIYQVLKNVKKDLILKIIIRFNNGVEATHIKNMVYYGNKYEDLNIHYQTDNLQDAINKAKLVSEINKYNL